jgi:hypothetical protein
VGVFTAEETKTYAKYVAAAIFSFVIGALTYIVPLLMDPSEPTISWRVALGTGIAAVMAAGISTRITRPGDEPLITQSNALAEAGVSPSHMIVVPSDTADITPSQAITANPRIMSAQLPENS